MSERTHVYVDVQEPIKINKTVNTIVNTIILKRK